MESGIDPGQDYYTQDYYNYDHGYDLPQYGSRRKLISPTGVYDEYGEVIMEDDGSYYYSPHESEAEVGRKGRRLAPPAGGAGPHRPSRQAFREQPAENITQPHNSRTERTSIKQLFERKSASSSPFYFPWKNNRIFPVEKGGAVDVPKPNSVDSGMVIDGSYFQTKETMPSAKTRLGKVLGQMNILRTLQNGSVSITRAGSEAERESQSVPADSGKNEHERGRKSEDVIRQSYTGSAVPFAPQHPFRLQDGAQMNALDSDDEREQSPVDSDSQSETNDTEIESKTESGTETTENETDQETEDGSESEQETEAESEESEESNSTKDSRETVLSITSSQFKYSSTTPENFHPTNASSGSDSPASTYSRSSSKPSFTSTHATSSRAAADEEHTEMDESVSEGHGEDPELSRSRRASEGTQDIIHSTNSFSVACSGVVKASEIHKLPPIAENDEGEMTSERSDDDKHNRELQSSLGF